MYEKIAAMTAINKESNKGNSKPKITKSAPVKNLTKWSTEPAVKKTADTTRSLSFFIIPNSYYKYYTLKLKSLNKLSYVLSNFW